MHPRLINIRHFECQYRKKQTKKILIKSPHLSDSTDLPSILSGETLAFIDPHERHFGQGETGTKLHVAKHSEIINSPQSSDQFTPYIDIFDDMPYDPSSAQGFPGTIFRFPVRNAPSVLCESTYGDEEMSRLFEAFLEDADIIPLFLRSIETIEMEYKPCNQSEGMTAKIEIFAESMDALRTKRNMFSRSLADSIKVPISQRRQICMTDQISIRMVTSDQEKHTDWVVSQVIGGKEMPDTVVKIVKKRGYIPLVGVAMPYNSQTGEGENEFRGRVFCFLPLPPGDESRTGLPFHIHGFFGVNSDRRSIKWPGTDRVQSDDEARWNFLLVTHLIPKAFVEMISFAINKQELSPSYVYKAWPNIEEVRPQWRKLLKPLCQALCGQSVIFTSSKSHAGEWKKIGEAVFNFLPEERVDKKTERVLLRVLSFWEVPIASVPPHVKKILEDKDLIADSIKKISPEIIIDCIHKSQHSILQNISAADKLVLLEYIVERVKATSLVGLRLLPLANGDFVPFAAPSQNVRTVLIPPQVLDKTLTYNMGRNLMYPVEGRLLSLLKKIGK